MNPFTGPPALRSRPSWSGLLRLSLVALPVKAYAAVATRPPATRGLSPRD
jgi:hypothetical protein